MSHIAARGLIIVFAIVKLSTDGMRLPGYALEILQGTDTYPGTTGISFRALKFWLAVLLDLATPIAALFMFAPLKLAKTAALVLVILSGAWWLAVLGFDISDAIMHENSIPPIWRQLMRSSFYALISILPTAAAYWFFSRSRP